MTLRMGFWRSILMSILACALLGPTLARSADWPGWLGPNRDGTLVEKVFSTDRFGLDVAWSRPLGIAYSGIVVVDDRAVTMFGDGEADWVTAMNTESGEELWRYRIDAFFTNPSNARFTGKARVFESEESAMKAILDGTIKKGDVMVIRSEGPKGGPGMREMLSPTSAIVGKGLSKDVALITDGRFSGGSHGFVVGHITPETYVGGPIAVVRNGDTITIDARKRELNLDISQTELKRRLARWKKPFSIPIPGRN